MTATKRPAPIQFRDGALGSMIEDRRDDAESPGAIAQRDLHRYYDSIEIALRRVSLSRNEVMLVLDALNGSVLDARSARSLAVEIGDAMMLDGLGAKWGIADEPALLNMLGGLAPFEQLAIVDAAERWWRMDPAVRQDEPAESLRWVGLIR